MDHEDSQDWCSVVRGPARQRGPPHAGVADEAAGSKKRGRGVKGHWSEQTVAAAGPSCPRPLHTPPHLADNNIRARPATGPAPLTHFPPFRSLFFNSL